MPIDSAATASSTVCRSASPAVCVRPPPGYQAPNERKPIFFGCAIPATTYLSSQVFPAEALRSRGLNRIDCTHQRRPLLWPRRRRRSGHDHGPPGRRLREAGDLGVVGGAADVRVLHAPCGNISAEPQFATSREQSHVAISLVAVVAEAEPDP